MVLGAGQGESRCLMQPNQGVRANLELYLGSRFEEGAQEELAARPKAPVHRRAVALPAVGVRPV